MTLTKFLASLDPQGKAAPILLDALFSDEEERAMLLKDRRRFEGDIMNKTGTFLKECPSSPQSVIPQLKSSSYSFQLYITALYESCPFLLILGLLINPTFLTHLLNPSLLILAVAFILCSVFPPYVTIFFTSVRSFEDDRSCQSCLTQDNCSIHVYTRRR